VFAVLSLDLLHPHFVGNKLADSLGLQFVHKLGAVKDA
jgi:hypothetical protein